MTIGHRDEARRRVAGPAVTLIVVSTVTLVLLLAGLVFSIWLLLSGMAEEMRQPAGFSKETQVLIRIGWNVLMQLCNALILFGAWRMKGLQNLGMARAACVLSLIPCCGPCFILGIPFGIWGLVVLSDPDVQAAFDAPTMARSH